MNDIIDSKLNKTPLGCWKFGGYLGKRIDIFAESRILNEQAWNRIYPQTEEVFRLRNDDTLYQGRGVWQGEFWGKYILSVIAACRYYNSEALKNRVSESAGKIIATQDQNGYIGTYTDSKYFGNNTWNIWCRKYTLWGLLEAWELLKEDYILEAAIKFADHIISEVGSGNHSIVETGTLAGLPSTSILKPVVMLYRITGYTRYMEFAEYIVDEWSKNENSPPDLLNKGLEGKPLHEWFPEPYNWAKSYELISCIEGMLDLYKIKGNSDYLKAAENIYSVIVDWERSPVGSISFNDKFIGSRYLINAVAEICDAVYWNRLSLELFRLTSKIKYIDEIERTLFNSLLCGMKSDGTWGLRRLRLSHAHIPAHFHFIENHQCCVDNLPRGFFQAAESAVFTDKNGVYFAIYNEGEGTVNLPSGDSLYCTIKGDVPDDEKITIQFSLAGSVSFQANFRLPYWSRRTIIKINGVEQKPEMNDRWASFVRKWTDGDIITLEFDLGLRLEWFDPTVFSETDPIVAWHIERWASMGVMAADENTGAHIDTPNVRIEDALPHKKAAVVFRGPVALARDIRLGDPDVHGPVSNLSLFEQDCDVRPLPAPEGIIKAYEAKLAAGEVIKLCDFASAGNTWDENSMFDAWFFDQNEG